MSSKPPYDLTSALQSLVRSFPAAKPLPEHLLMPHYSKGDFTGLTRVIKQHLRLPMRLRIGYVNAPSSQNPRAPAWIVMPRPMPMYGSPSFNELAITMYLCKSFLAEASFHTAVSGIAHELCHLILSSVHHPRQAEEEAVDLTAMLLGFEPYYLAMHEWDAGEMLSGLMPDFQQIFGTSTGWQPPPCGLPTGLTFGYLSVDQVKLASFLIRGYLRR